MAIAQKYLLKVKKSGPENIMAKCPFHAGKHGHEEQNPSFTMSLTQGLYYCFSCHERGNLITFLRNIGVPRIAIERQYKYVIEEVQRRSPQRAQPLQKLALGNQPLPESLLGVLDKCPTDLINEGYDEELLQRLDVGFDDLHMRITYPLRDLQGTLIGISGRAVNDQRPRYKVYDTEYRDWELPIHKTFKSHVLWNGHLVYPQAFFANQLPLVVVEGFKACMSVIQAGYPNVVAILGSMLSKQQQWQIERLASEVFLFLDNNKAGFHGTVWAGMDLGVPTRLVSYPDDREQPSDLTKEEIQLALTEVTDFHKWLLTTPEAMDVYRERREKQASQW